MRFGLGRHLTIFILPGVSDARSHRSVSVRNRKAAQITASLSRPVSGFGLMTSCDPLLRFP
jgi:hypothetical protein